MAVNNINRIVTLVRGLINDQLKTTGYQAEEYVSSATFTILEDFIDSDTLIVKHNGSTLDEVDWSYNSSTNTATITPVTSGLSLTSGDTIEFFFSYYQKYSDVEIKGYIKSALAWFAIFRHHKLFEIDVNGDVVPLDGQLTNTAEEYLIATVTAITIDPENVEIRTPDFTLIPVQNMSKKEQIAFVFSNWRRFVGNIEAVDMRTEDWRDNV